MKTKVLLVDDDASVVAALSGVLRAEGYDVIQAFDGHQALEHFSAVGGADIALLDLNMPVKGGWDTFERLTAINPLLPIIVITGRPDQYPLAVVAGVAALMEKPLDIPLLLESVRKLLAETPETRLARIAGQAPHTLYLGGPDAPLKPTSNPQEEYEDNKPQQSKLHRPQAIERLWLGASKDNQRTDFTMNSKTVGYLVFYGGFLIVMGLAGYLSNPENAKTALMSGGTFGAISILWGVLGARGVRWSLPAAMTSTGLLAVVFAWRASVSWLAVRDGHQAKWFAASLITLMLAASIAMLIRLVKARKASRAETEARLKNQAVAL